MSKCKCMKCGKINGTKDWHKTTVNNVKKYGHSGNDVPELTKELIEKKECLYYVCPDCGETCYLEDAQIEFIK